ncbi:MAG: efflux RND transporter periplasmic adaptor subunit [Sinobacteraceae bacterium]|nr:efflux RND transporter periplasmic adaptor subunit [Nevskiaceae bacterium]
MAKNKTVGRAVVVAVVLAVAVVVGVAVVHKPNKGGAGVIAREAGHGHGSGAEHQAPLPVDVAPVSRRDLPVYLNGLGTVQAYNTVTVRPQVGGQLVSVDFDEGDEVRKGQLLARIDPRTYQAALDQAKAKLAQDQAQLQSAQMDLSRFQKLAPQGYVSGQQLDQQKQLVAQHRAAVAADRAAIKSAAVQLSYTRITSPIDGRLGMRLVDAGNVVSPGSGNGIVVVTQMKPISVVFNLPEQQLEQVLAAGALSGETSLKVQALDRSNSTVLATGKLAAVNNRIDTSTGTIELKATFANQKEKLWPGQFVNTRLLVQHLTQALVVPVAAVQRGPDGAYVYVVEDDNTVRMQAVETGVSEGGFIQIVQGLKAGLPVVVDGQYHLKPGARVKPQTLTPAQAASVVPAAGASAALTTP